jgi:serine/threonine-protein kinase
MASSGSMGKAGNVGVSEAEDVPRALGRYLLLRRIARGGMGEVFLASTTGLEGAERPVVVKIIRREHAQDPSFIARFLDEARVQAQLQHSGVAQVLDAATDERTGEPYAVVEHVEGRSLGDVRARAMQIGHAIGWADAVAIGTLIAEALAHVHERQDPSGKALAIVHRDLSPQNVMVSYVGDCKIIDFGTARGQNRRCHTVAGVVFAKPGYVAPEVANGDSGDARVDLYALGVMLWELCAGRRFLQGDAGVHMAAVARNAKDLPPVAVQVGAPAELDAIIARLTAFDRDARYSAGPSAAADLARLLGSAGALPSGERGVRARAAHLMKSLFPGEPGKTRREFARLVAAAREQRAELIAARGAAPLAAPAAAPPAEEGALPGTRYRILAELGRGASSVVYEAEHLDLGRRVAIKVITAEHSRSPAFAARFRREARALSRLSHQGLVAIHDVGQASDGRLFCVMELLEGETLGAFLAREKGVDWREALRLGERALAALEVSHAAGLVHRDLKPENLFLAGEGGVSATLKILDFGLARALDEAGDGAAPDASRAAGMSLFGTPEYMAPEQAASGQVDGRADIYALGCVLYEMLTGRLPFVGPSPVAIVDAKIKGSPERPRDRAPARQIPDAVDALVMRALARHPSVRFQTATEMRLAIEAALAGPAKRRAGRRLVTAGAVLAMAAFAAAVVAGKGRVLKAAAEWRHPHRAEVAQVAAATAPAQDPAASGEGEGEDFDFVDDTLPGAPASAPSVAAETPPAAPVVTPAETATVAAAPPPRARHRKHPANAAAKVAARPPAKDVKAGGAAKADQPAAPDGTASPKPARRKHKPRVAQAQ